MNLSNNFACNYFRPNGISFFYREFLSLTGNGDSLASDGEVYLVHSPRTHSHARLVSCVWLKLFKLTLECSLCALSPKHSLSCTHAMFRKLLDPPWLHFHRALLPHLLCCSLHTGLPLPLRKLDSCLADLPNSLRSHSERIGNQSWFCQRCRSDS